MRPLLVVIPDPTSASVFGMPLWLWALVGGAALFGAFQVYYWVGHKVGDKIYSSRLGNKIGLQRILVVENAVRKWGALAVYGCFWVPGLRHTLPWVAGVLRISYPWYVVASALGCLTWVPVTLFGLYSVLWGWLLLAADSPLLAGSVAALVAALIAVVATVRRRRRGRRAGDQEETLAGV
ncbi:membrane protein DedA, SNARE-associated domain [Sinosporangium album]|uniref:Membrane protein DedA, SNARE-associated domain n=1 Tax=Sinosporangium album TaxID=504805 RepID=A0A1G8C0V8_9ACTN|nr:VTT domain-containing protein [Sinosporangium album]SDH39107.1 membrane protein DedA, SNARE-associated domain [Sinosporangium album]